MNSGTEFAWPLMSNNITRGDLDRLIKYLQQENPRLTHGPKVIEFENAWAKWLGVKNACMVNSGASANDITMLALREFYGLGEVIVPTLTWVSDIASVVNAGFEPVFVDIDPKTLGMSINHVMSKISSKTKAIFITHVLGFNAIEEKLLENLHGSEIVLIEDVCESHGATLGKNKLGSVGFASNFSFYFAHHMSTIEGGMICSNDDDFMDVCRMMRSHGLVRESRIPERKQRFIKENPSLNPEFIFRYAAHNMRPTELNAVLGLSQLENLDENILKRNMNFHQFLSTIDRNIFRFDYRTEGMSNYAFTLVMQEPNMVQRDKIEKRFRDLGIEFRRGLSGGGNQLRQPYLKELSAGLSLRDFPEVEHIHHFSWYLGNYPDLPQDRFEMLEQAISDL